MHKTVFGPALSAGVVLVLVSVACGAATVLTTETPAPTTVPSATAPPTASPTSTPKPTATPNIEATKEVQEAQQRIAGYVEAGYFQSAKGTLYTLDNLQKELAKQHYLDIASAGYPDKVKDFAVWADIKEESASTVNYPEFSGCGFVVRIQDNGDDYYALLTKDSVVMAYCLVRHGGTCGRVGKTRGTGNVDLESPFEARFEFIINGMHAYALINSNFVAEYTLFADKVTEPGYFGYGMISGTNRDYGTRCTIENAKLWIPTQ